MNKREKVFYTIFPHAEINRAVRLIPDEAVEGETFAEKVTGWVISWSKGE